MPETPAETPPAAGAAADGADASSLPRRDDPTNTQGTYYSQWDKFANDEAVEEAKEKEAAEAALAAQASAGTPTLLAVLCRAAAAAAVCCRADASITRFPPPGAPQSQAEAEDRAKHAALKEAKVKWDSEQAKMKQLMHVVEDGDFAAPKAGGNGVPKVRTTLMLVLLLLLLLSLLLTPPLHPKVCPRVISAPMLGDGEGAKRVLTFKSCKGWSYVLPAALKGLIKVCRLLPACCCLLLRVAGAAAAADAFPSSRS